MSSPSARSPRTQSELTTDVVAGARVADEASIAVLWRALQPELLRYLRSLGAEQAQDVASVIWTEFARVLPNLTDDEPVSARKMLFTIARRRRVDEFRRRSRDREVLRFEPRDQDVPDTSTTAALSAVDDALGLDGVLAMLRQLPPAQAEVIVLRTISGFSAEEVGELTGQTPGAVRVMAHRGLATLRELLEPELGLMHQSLDPAVTNGAAASKS